MQKHYKILLGGSPCTYWSISQSSDKRETTASGDMARNLYNAGYRKQSDTVKEFAVKIAPLRNAMRLIDADALLSDIERTIEESGCVNHEGEIMDCVRYAPTVDIAQVCRLELAEQYGREEK